MRYDLNLLPVFVALMEERNVTRTAEKLNLTQPALSNSLQRLRDTLRDPLFIRERHGMRPTQFALNIAPKVRSAVAVLDEMVNGQQVFDPTKSDRSFTVASSGYVEFVLMPSLVNALSKRAPGIRLKLVPYGTDLGETGVTSGDTALVLGRAVDPVDSLVVQHLMEDGLRCVVRADHPEVRKKLTRTQYEKLRHVNVVPTGRTPHGLQEALRRQKLTRDVAVSVTHFLAVPEMIAHTDYCSTLPIEICKRLKSDGRLRFFDPPVNLGTFPVQMIWHTRYRHDPAHQWLRSLVQEVARGHL